MTYTVSPAPHMDLYAVKHPDAPAAIGIADPGTADWCNHTLCGFLDRNHAEFVACALNHLDQLKSRTLTATEFIRLERAALTFPQLNVFARHNGDGSYRLTHPDTDHTGRTVQRKIGIAIHGDGSDAEATALQITSLFQTVPEVLDEAESLLFVRKIVQGLTITLDRYNGPVFDQSTWSLKNVFNSDNRTIRRRDVVNSKTGERLADVLMGCDGHILQAVAPKDSDFRMISMSTEDTRQPFTCLLTPDEIETLTALSVRTHTDVGRILARGLDHAA